MASIFKAADVALAAMEVEQRGKAFYDHLVEVSEDPRTKELFAYLAEEEVAHENTFREMYDRIKDVAMPAWCNEEEFLNYLRSLIDTHTLFVYGDLEVVKEKVKTREDAMRLAMSFEKDSILFFKEMKDFVPESEKKHVEECIEEERSHLRKLTGMR
ncbi:MAG: rubrerythrin [Desulfobacterales bacterium]|nr:MAG: rubrerythrin [Desulfobacterales bacterium]